MRKIYLSLSLLLAGMGLTNAQRVCGTMDHYQMLMNQDPSYAQRIEQIEEHTRQIINNGGERVVVNIPVVFHVVYKTSAQNISDALLQAQLDQLNQDFRKLNSDASLVPALFSGLAADMEINFCLAQQTPTGAATTGIVRKLTTVTSFSDNDAVKYSSSGGDNAWDATKYLNLWVCNMSGGILGYAQFPGGPAATDGVVLQYNTVGSRTNPGSAAPYNLGRTATHEVGHWLNLRHIWGDASCGSDLVNDTPTHSTSNFGCPSYPKTNTCSGGGTEMTMNYMDYTDDACMYMFSAGQKARSQALFNSGGSRVGLLTSNGCSAPSGGTTCNVPSSLGSSSITSSTATVSWAAASGAVSYSLQYKTSAASTWNTVTTSSTSYSLTGLSASTAYNFQVASVCSGGTSAYSTASSFTTSAVSTSCTDTWESNNTTGTAKTIAVATNIQATIGTSTDKDYFKFSNTSTKKNVKVTLTNLVADYDLKLYKGTSTLIGTSQNGGTTSESLIYNTTSTATTYYAYVYGYGGAYSATSCYTLRAEISSTSFARLSGETEVDESMITEGALSVYPNPSNGTLNIRLQPEADLTQTITVYNQLGQEVDSYEVSFTKEQPAVEIRMNDLNDGIYFVRVFDGNTVQTRKVLLRK
ncbi:MAG TPA: M43 family zinc metalloprotease [Flavobacteriales bacterium]|nr:M43 family zinc metalloprotease [Flavobacteriales bacterium]